MSRRSRKLVSLCTAVMVATVIAACGDDAADSGQGGAEGEESSPFRVLAILPTSGPLAQQAAMGVNGLEASAEKLNAGDGICGRQVEVEVVDDKLDPTLAVTELQKAINSGEAPDYVLAGITSNEGLAMAPLLSTNKILSGAVSSSAELNDPEKYPYHFGLQAASDQNYKNLLAHVQDEGVEKIGFIAANDALGTYNTSAMEELAADAGIELATESYDTTATDLTAPMDALRAENPDLVVLSGFGPAVGHLLSARQKLGWDVPVIGDVGVSGSNPAALVEPALLDGVRIQTFTLPSKAHEDEWLPDAQEMIDAVAEQGEINQIITLASLPYDGLQLLAVAGEQAGGCEPDELKEALENLESPEEVPWTSLGSYGWSADNHFPVTEASDYVYVEATPLESGQFPAGG